VNEAISNGRGSDAEANQTNRAKSRAELRQRNIRNGGRGPQSNEGTASSEANVTDNSNEARANRRRAEAEANQTNTAISRAWLFQSNRRGRSGGNND